MTEQATTAAAPPVTRRTVLSWSLWDWGSSSWNAVITSFVFGPYIVRGVVGDARPGGLSANTWLGISSAAAGLVIALIAPVTGQRSDAGGHRKRSLAIWTGAVVAIIARPVLDPQRAQLPVGRARAAGGRRRVQRIRRRLLQRHADPGLHPGHDREGVGFRLVDGLLRRNLPAPDLLRGVHRARRRLVRGHLRRRPQHPGCRGVLGGLVRRLRRARVAGGTRGPGRTCPAPRRLRCLLPAAGARHRVAVPPRPQRGLLPHRLGALPRRTRRRVQLRRDLGRQRLRHGPSHRADLRGGRQRGGRAGCPRAGPDRGTGSDPSG